MRKWIAVTAALLLAACASPTSPSVTVAPYNALTVPFDSLEAFVAQRPVIATGKVVAVNDHAYEVPVDPNAEGNTADDGPEIFATISLKIESVLKGDIKPGSTLTLVYMSGKWNTVDKKSRIAYTYDAMAHLQKQDATLKTPAEFNSATFMIFAAPNSQASVPVKADNLYAGLPVPVNAAGQVVFTKGLFVSPANPVVKLDEVKAAIG